MCAARFGDGRCRISGHASDRGESSLLSFGFAYENSAWQGTGDNQYNWQRALRQVFSFTCACVYWKWSWFAFQVQVSADGARENGWRHLGLIMSAARHVSERLVVGNLCTVNRHFVNMFFIDWTLSVQHFYELCIVFRKANIQYPIHAAAVVLSEPSVVKTIKLKRFESFKQLALISIRRYSMLSAFR